MNFKSETSIPISPIKRPHLTEKTKNALGKQKSPNFMFTLHTLAKDQP